MSHNRSTRHINKEKQPEKAGPLLVAIAGFMLILLASLALIRPASSAFQDLFGKGTPSLKVDQEKVDLGDIKLGKSVSVTFQAHERRQENAPLQQRAIYRNRTGLLSAGACHQFDGSQAW